MFLVLGGEEKSDKIEDVYHDKCLEIAKTIMPIFNVLRISINKFLDQWPDHPTLKTVSAIISLHFLISTKPSGYFREFSRKKPLIIGNFRRKQLTIANYRPKKNVILPKVSRIFRKKPLMSGNIRRKPLTIANYQEKTAKLRELLLSIKTYQTQFPCSLPKN